MVKFLTLPRSSLIILEVCEKEGVNLVGKKAILIYAGKDATEEFNMMHKKDVVEKYAPEIILGKIQM
jgi:hypothetical protein